MNIKQIYTVAHLALAVGAVAIPSLVKADQVTVPKSATVTMMYANTGKTKMITNIVEVVEAIKTNIVDLSETKLNESTADDKYQPKGKYVEVDENGWIEEQLKLSKVLLVGAGAVIGPGNDNDTVGEYSLIAGTGNAATGKVSVVSGRRARSTHDYTFVFNGDDSTVDFYSDHGKGTVNFNPAGDTISAKLGNFYIGDDSLRSIIGNASISTNAVIDIVKGMSIDGSKVIVDTITFSTDGGNDNHSGVNWVTFTPESLGMADKEKLVSVTFKTRDSGVTARNMCVKLGRVGSDLQLGVTDMKYISANNTKYKFTFDVPVTLDKGVQYRFYFFPSRESETSSLSFNARVNNLGVGNVSDIFIGSGGSDVTYVRPVMDVVFQRLAITSSINKLIDDKCEIVTGQLNTAIANLNTSKQNKLTAGSNVSLADQADGTTTINVDTFNATQINLLVNGVANAVKDGSLIRIDSGSFEETLVDNQRVSGCTNIFFTIDKFGIPDDSKLKTISIKSTSGQGIPTGGMTFRLGIRVKGTTDYLTYSDFKTVTSKSTVYTWSLMKELTVSSGVVYEISFFDDDDIQCNYPVSLYIDGNEHGVWVSAGGDEYPTWKPIINATWWTPCTLRALKSIINMTP